MFELKQQSQNYRHVGNPPTCRQMSCRFGHPADTTLSCVCDMTSDVSRHSPTRHRMSAFGQQNRHANIRHVELRYTQDNLCQAMNTREGQSHISCVLSRPNLLHPQVQPPLTFVICRRIDADRHQCLPSSHVIRMNTKKIYPSLLCRVLSVCSTAFIVLIWPQPPLSHILSHRSSHFSCQSVHHLISATLFVSIPSSSHLSLSKSSCNWFYLSLADYPPK